jgi:hypothetical protein
VDDDDDDAADDEDVVNDNVEHKTKKYMKLRGRKEGFKSLKNLKI